MKKFILLMVMALITTGATAQQASTGDVLAAAQLANKYFMTKYADPTVPTNVKRIRPSSLWTRAVYYEGLMALYELDKNPAYIDYTDRWANFHEWTPRNGVKTTDADDQCCAQTYLERYMMTHEERMITHVRENLDLQMATGKLHGAVTPVAADCSTPQRDCGGAMPTMCRPTRRATVRTATGAAAADGCMPPSSG